MVLCLGVGLLVERLVAVRLPGPARARRRPRRHHRRRRAADDPRRDGRAGGAGLRRAGRRRPRRRAPAARRHAGRPVRRGLSRVRVAVAVVGPGVDRRLHQARRLGDLARADRPPDGARARHRRRARRRPSSSTSTQWLGQGYPVGTFMPVGSDRASLSFQDYSNVYQPVICVYAGIFARRACTASCASSCAHAGWRLGAAFVGVAGVAVRRATRGGGRSRRSAWRRCCRCSCSPRAPGIRARCWSSAWLAAAFMDCFGAGGVLWAGAGCAAAALLALRRPLGRFFAWSAGGVRGAWSRGRVPAIVVLGDNATQTTQGAPVAQEDLGKLYAPLDLLQGAGLWPAGDFRVPPDPSWIAVALAVAGLLGRGGRGGRRGAPARVASARVAGADRGRARCPAIVVGGPWIDAKVLAVTAAVLLCGSGGAGGDRPRARRRRSPARSPSCWSPRRRSRAGSRRATSTSPRATRSPSCATLGEQTAGKGPYLLLNYEGYATRYQLYRADVEGASDLRVSLIPGKNGEPFPNFSTVEVDDVDTAALFAFPLIGRRLTPVGSRPPSAYEPFSQGRVLRDLAARRRPTGRAPVARRRLAARRRRHLRAAAAAGARRVDARGRAAREPARARPRRRRSCRTAGRRRPACARCTDGTATLGVDVPKRGRAGACGSAGGVLGSPRGRRRRGARSATSAMRSTPRSAGSASARSSSRPGSHEVTLTASRSWWRPGRGDDEGQLPLGPLALTREAEPALERVPSGRGRPSSATPAPTTGSRCCD